MRQAKVLIVIQVFFLSLASYSFAQTDQHSVFEIGISNDKATGMALSPDDYEKFLEYDFGWEDKFYLVGYSNPEDDWPYILPGPEDSWGGTGPTAGIRSHVLNILIGFKEMPNDGNYNLVIDLVGYNRKVPPLFKVTVNDTSWTYQLPEGKVDSSLVGDPADEHKIEIPINQDVFAEGGNQIQLTTLQGSWMVFDQVKLNGPEEVRLEDPENLFVRSVEPAGYEIEKEGERYQPLLVDIEHLQGDAELKVELEGEQIFKEVPEKDRYKYEVPMPAVDSSKDSRYTILIDDNVVQTGKIKRKPGKIQTPADYVDTMMGAAHSRWMIAPGPWMPFSMVKLSPDNQNSGWQAGYDPTFESVGGFSHIHEWTMAGLGMLPVNGPLKIKVGDEAKPDDGYRSRINKFTEEAPLGYYKVDLEDYDITAELTATTRAGFQRYTYPQDSVSRIMIDLKVPAEYDYELDEVEIKKVDDYRLEGYSKQHSDNVWSNVTQDYTLHFVIEFDQPIQTFGSWIDDKTFKNRTLKADSVNDAGAYVEFDTRKDSTIQVRTGISLVSIENAKENLATEISEPFGWSFDQVRGNQKETWNNILDRIKIESNDQREKRRFYTNMYRSSASRNIWSDVNGEWIDPTENVQRFDDQDAVALGGDAFWNTFWNLNQLWNLIIPEWSSKWVKSQLAMYDANGWLAKGPAGIEYIPVMVAEHEIPFIVGAYQMGIQDFDIEKAFEAILNMQTTTAERVGGGLTGNRDLETYLEHQYVPFDEGRFSNTMEYSFDDWTVSQLAKTLGENDVYEDFRKRGNWWKNAIDEETGFARMKDTNGNWLSDFDPYRSGANEHYVEGNAWQLTFFVPQDVPALAEEIGVDRFVDRLNWGFTESNKWRFNAPNDQYWDYPVIQGNQQSMHFAFLFNWVEKPWLTQKWSRAVMDRYYGYGVANAYLGDEDQGQMSAWFVMNAIGLFQTDGGTRADPIFEIGSPIFEKIEIDLGGRYERGEKFTIEAKNTSRVNKYVQKAILNGEELETFKFPAEEILNGGKLILEMGPKPYKSWGINK